MRNNVTFHEKKSNGKNSVCIFTEQKTPSDVEFFFACRRLNPKEPFVTDKQRVEDI